MKINVNYVLVSALLISGCGGGSSPASPVANPNTIAQNYQKLGATVDGTQTADITLDEKGYPRNIGIKYFPESDALRGNINPLLVTLSNGSNLLVTTNNSFVNQVAVASDGNPVYAQQLGTTGAIKARALLNLNKDLTPDDLSAATAKAIENAMDDITIDGDPGIEKGLVAGGDFSLTIPFANGSEAPDFTGVQLYNTKTGTVVKANTLSVRVEGTNLVVEGLLPDVTGTFQLKLLTDYQGEEPEKYGNILLQEPFTITQAEQEPEPETVDLNLVNFNLASYFPNATFESGTTPTVDIPASFDLSQIEGDGPFEVVKVELNGEETALGETGVEAQEGINTVEVTVLEQGGDNQFKIITTSFTLEAEDTIAPSTPTISELPENNKTTEDVTPVLVKGEMGSTIYVNGESTGIIMQYLDGEYINLNTSELGENTFEITTVDTAGNESEPVTITLERVETGGGGTGTGEGGF